MKAFFARVTLIRVFCSVLGLLSLLILILSKEHHSIFHWEIVFGLAIVIILLLTIEYFLKRKVKNTGRLLFYELIILAVLLGVWSLLAR
jgi:hypothetical protein